MSFTHLIGFAVVQAIHETVPGHELVLRRGRGGQATGRPPRAREPRHRRRPREERRQPHAPRAGRARCRHARLPLVLGRLRGAHPQGALQQAQPRRLQRHHRQPHQPGHDRHPAVGAEAHAGPGSHRRASAASTTRPSGRRPTRSRWPTSACRRSSRSAPPTTTGSSRARSPASSSSASRSSSSAQDGFYDEVFRALGVPYEAVQWRRDVNPIDREQAMLEKQMAVANLIRVHRVRGHLIADLDPLRWKEPDMPVELDPATYGLTIWDLDREFLTGGLARARAAARSATCSTCCATPTAARSASSTCTSRIPIEQHWIQEQVEGVAPELDLDDQRYILERLNAAEAFEKFLATKYVGPEAVRARRGRVRHPDPRRHPRGRRRRRPRRLGHRHAPPRSPQRAHQHRGQELRPALQGVRGPGRPRLHAGLRRREVPPRAGRQVRRPVRQGHHRRAGRQPEPPRGGRPGRGRHGPREAGRHQRPRGLLRAADPHARRRRVRRSGRGGRDAQHERHQGLPRRRHDPRRGEQPDRVHHHARSRPARASTPPTSPRSSRRRSST